MAKHAMLSASGAERWLLCPPSARLELTIEEIPSEYADEGTLAHMLGEIVIKEKAYGLDLSHLKRDIEAHELYSEEMAGYIDEYANFVVEQVRDAPAGSILIQEHKVYFTEYVPEGYGTVDNGIIGPGVLKVIDLKYGKGVPVDAYENKQQMLYALGMLLDYEVLFDIDTIVVTIYQPRINNVSSYTITKSNLLLWANEVLKPIALKAFSGEGDYLAGDHCRFCRARPNCKTNTAYNLQVAVREFDVATVTDEQVVKVFLRADAIKNWLNAVETFVKREAIAGRKWPGLKVVEGRSVRKYTDEEQIINNLTKAGYEDLTKSKIIGITDLTKKVSKDDFNNLVKPYVHKPKGSPTVVHISDGRPEWDRTADAANDFE